MKKLLILFAILATIPCAIYAEEFEVELEKCVDGDTAKFKLSNNEVETFRFLAVDTPETVHPTKGEEPFGKDASNYTCKRLTEAKKITLEYDEKSNKTDNYGRGLVWVFVDDALLQEELVEKGYAEVAYLYGKYKYNDLLKDTQEVAKVNKVGIWSLENDEQEKDEITEENETSSLKEQIEETIEEKKKNFISDIINTILEKIAACISEIIDSILNDMDM